MPKVVNHHLYTIWMSSVYHQFVSNSPACSRWWGKSLWQMRRQSLPRRANVQQDPGFESIQKTFLCAEGSFYIISVKTFLYFYIMYKVERSPWGKKATFMPHVLWAEIMKGQNHCPQKGPYYRDRVPIGTFLTFCVPIGSLFIFQGPYFQCFGKFTQRMSIQSAST